MNLIRKIKNCKRHRQNKKLKGRAEIIQWLATVNVLEHNSNRFFIVSPLMYEIIRYYHNVPNNLKCSGLIKDDTEFIMSSQSVINFFEDNTPRWLKRWCSVPKGCDIPFAGEPLCLHVDSPIPPKPSVSVKEI